MIRLICITHPSIFYAFYEKSLVVSHNNPTKRRFNKVQIRTDSSRMPLRYACFIYIYMEILFSHVPDVTYAWLNCETCL